MADELKPLRIAILTTQTPHHAYLVREVAARYAPVKVFEERRGISARFETHHAFEDERLTYEREVWFGGKDVPISDFAETETFEDVNDPDCIGSLRAFGPDAIVVFGTGRLSDDLISVLPDRIIDLHGANPEEYSGLDTHLWAIYHRDFDSLVSTLHKVASPVDRGGVVLKAAIPLTRDMKLSHLRRANTEVGTRLVLSGLEMLQEFGQFIARPQNRRGRRYSHMPAVLKADCVEKFERYTATL